MIRSWHHLSGKNFDFAMALLHTRWTDDEEGSREEEVRSVAEQINWMKKFIPEVDLLLDGDFNYSGSATPMVEMAEGGKSATTR